MDRFDLPPRTHLEKQLRLRPDRDSFAYPGGVLGLPAGRLQVVAQPELEPSQGLERWAEMQLLLHLSQ